MPRWQYRCTDCGTLQPVAFLGDVDGPPGVVRAVCGTRYGGCGEKCRLEHEPDA